MSSLIDKRVKVRVLEFLKREQEEALRRGDVDLAVEIGKAKRLIKRGAWKVRRPNPYIKFMSKCLVEVRKGSSLKDVQEAMRECAKRWREMSKEEREKFREEGLWLYDYS